jgi:glycosyltransferase involved in cell wall biosynthesis
VVTSTINGIPELVKDGSNGYLLPPGRADLLADALAKLAADPELRRQFGNQARTDVIEGFSLSRCAEAQRDFLAAVPAKGVSA